MIDERMVEEIRAHGPGRMVCPSCGGGSSKERCMAITVDKENNSALWATCFRNNCDVTSVRVLDNGFSYSTDGPKATADWRYPHPTRKMDDLRYPSRALEYEYMLDWRFLDSLSVTVRTGMGSELVFPVCNHSGQVIGHTVKRLSMTTSPALSKASNYFDKLSPDWEGGAFVGVGLPQRGPASMSGAAPSATPPYKGCVLVEDMLSAYRITQECEDVLAVALLGTQITGRLLSVLTRMAIPVTLALDADATSKAVKQVIAFNSQVTIRAARLFHDPKDMTQGELERLVQIVTTPLS